jgi:NAD-dependent dihydropyrimidine dehydrogenase PreA subunit
MASGRKAAVSIDRYVRGQSVTLDRIREASRLLADDLDLSRARRYPRAVMPQIDIDMRKRSFALIHTGYEGATARKEGDRCLRCAKAVEYYNECWYCLPCEIECPTEALRLEIPFLVS